MERCEECGSEKNTGAFVHGFYKIIEGDAAVDKLWKLQQKRVYCPDCAERVEDMLRELAGPMSENADQ